MGICVERVLCGMCMMWRGYLCGMGMKWRGYMCGMGMKRREYLCGMCMTWRGYLCGMGMTWRGYLCGMGMKWRGYLCGMGMKSRAGRAIGNVGATMPWAKHNLADDMVAKHMLLQEVTWVHMLGAQSGLRMLTCGFACLYGIDCTCPQIFFSRPLAALSKKLGHFKLNLGILGRFRRRSLPLAKDPHTGTGVINGIICCSRVGAL